MTTKKKPSKIIWGERTIFPMFYGFCPNKEAWDKEVREHISSPLSPEYPTDSYGMTTHITNKFDHSKQLCIVTMNDRVDTQYLNDAVSVILHESMHVWQCMIAQVREFDPGLEVEAYAVQHIFDNLFSGYLETRRCPIRVGPVLPSQHNPF
jgi:hypothetical protein